MEAGEEPVPGAFSESRVPLGAYGLLDVVAVAGASLNPSFPEFRGDDDSLGIVEPGSDVGVLLSTLVDLGDPTVDLGGGRRAEVQRGETPAFASRDVRAAEGRENDAERPQGTTKGCQSPNHAHARNAEEPRPDLLRFEHPMINQCGNE